MIFMLLSKKYNQSYNMSNEKDIWGALKNNVFDNLYIIIISQKPVEDIKKRWDHQKVQLYL